MEKDLTIVIVIWPKPESQNSLRPQMFRERALRYSADVARNHRTARVMERTMAEGERWGCFSVMKYVFIGNSDVQ